MSRRGGAKPAGIQLFPFLAVLICTMGALVVLLHAFASHGRQEAEKAAEAKNRAQQEQDELDADYFRWRSAHLRETRDKTKSDLEAERLKLSHIEEHQRRLEGRLAELKIAAIELEKTGEATASEQSQKEAELAEVQAEIQRVRTAIIGARDKGKFQAVNYCVVPYDGKYGTHRRPIYIECRGDRMILQPEGVSLLPDDFLGDFGPGNPLSVLLRAQREYLAKQTSAGKLEDEPYPLLLVRPDGIATYWYARQALDASGSEFGYELVSADWDFVFPPVDAQLKALTIEVLVETRQRMAGFVAAQKQLLRARSRPSYHADGPGSISRESGSEAGTSTWAHMQNGAFQGGKGEGTKGGLPLGASDKQLRSTGPGESLAQGETPYSSTATGPEGTPSTENPASGAGRAASAADKPGEPCADPLAQGTSPYGKSQAPDDQTGTNYDLMSSTVENGVKDADAFSREAADGEQAGGAHNPDAPKGTKGGTSTTPSDSVNMHLSKGEQSKKSIAATRGHGWGVHSEVGSVGATRPVLVRCSADKLVIVSDMPRMPSQEIPLQSATEDAIDSLVSGVRKQTRSWGTAGRGMYWKPTLVIEVLPGGEQRFNDIQQLLTDSGFDVKKRGNSPPAGQAIRPTQQQ